MAVPQGDGVWEMCKLATDENCRCRGAGSAVFAACMEYAIARGARKLMLVTNHILTSALRLYEKFGFKNVPLVSDEYERIDRQYEYEVS